VTRERERERERRRGEETRGDGVEGAIFYFDSIFSILYFLFAIFDFHFLFGF
jgi:hypothetical protein